MIHTHSTLLGSDLPPFQLANRTRTKDAIILAKLIQLGMICDTSRFGAQRWRALVSRPPAARPDTCNVNCKTIAGSESIRII